MRHARISTSVRTQLRSLNRFPKEQVRKPKADKHHYVWTKGYHRTEGLNHTPRSAMARGGLYYVIIQYFVYEVLSVLLSKKKSFRSAQSKYEKHVLCWVKMGFLLGNVPKGVHWPPQVDRGWYCAVQVFLPWYLLYSTRTTLGVRHQSFIHRENASSTQELVIVRVVLYMG